MPGGDDAGIGAVAAGAGDPAASNRQPATILLHDINAADGPGPLPHNIDRLLSCGTAKPWQFGIRIDNRAVQIDQIAIQRDYEAYRGPAERRADQV